MLLYYAVPNSNSFCKNNLKVMTPHGPDAASYYENVRKECKEPTKFDRGLAFMFESSAMCKISKYALSCEQRERGYAGCCWDGFKNTFPDMHA